MKEPAELILEWKQAGEGATRDALYRALVESENWKPPVAESLESRSPFEPFIEELLPVRTEDGRRVRALCTCYDASEAYVEKFGPTAFSDYAGDQIFGIEWQDTDALCLDPGTPQELVIEAEDFPRLKTLAEAVAVEQAWRRISKGNEEDGDLGRVVGYEGYHLAVVQKPEGMVMIHVPHDDGGMFVPIFTHTDALVLALPEFERDFGEAAKTIEVSGIKAFPVIANETATGLVFNYRGPTEPLAFGLGITELLIDEIAKLPTAPEP